MPPTLAIATLDAVLLVQHLAFFLFGACIGSFLNVVVYRLPLGISVNKPKRSFCPKCQRQLPARENIPIFGWLFLRGKCSGCKESISFRYPFVELLTALAFLAASLTFPLGHAVVMALLFALLITATFIDIDHFIIPHRINITGAVIGLIASCLILGLHNTTGPGQGLLRSVIGGLAGMGILWAVVEAGKLAFGKKKVKLDKAETWSITQPNEEEPPVFKIGEDEFSWWELFARKSDRLVVDCEKCVLNGKAHNNATLVVQAEELSIETDGFKLSLEDLKTAKGTAESVIIPREAMGLGDVWFLGMIGTFIGWQGVLFTVGASAIMGSIVPLITRLIGKADLGGRIPYGPYLAAGAVVWIFAGEQIFDWYWGLVTRR